MRHLNNDTIILATSSTTRHRVLAQTGVPFQVMNPTADEDALRERYRDQPLGDQAQYLAQAKAASVSHVHPDHYVIGADQICALNDHIFEKPGTPERALAQLTQLQGNTHQLYSGVCLMLGEQELWRHTVTCQLHMQPWSQAELAAYIDHDRPFGSCGGYQFEGKGRLLFEHVEGSDDAIQGLPLMPLLGALRAQNAMSAVSVWQVASER